MNIRYGVLRLHFFFSFLFSIHPLDNGKHFKGNIRRSRAIALQRRFTVPGSLLSFDAKTRLFFFFKHFKQIEFYRQMFVFTVVLTMTSDNCGYFFLSF